MKNLILALIFVPLLLMSCGKDDDSTNQDSPSIFTVTVENVVTPHLFYQSGVASIPTGATDPGPIFPGDSYEINFNAGPNILPMDGGPKLSFVTMFVQSNDLFLAPDEQGIALFDGTGAAIGQGTATDVTDQVQLWDAGTEVNEVTGGPNQKPQQDATAGQMNATDVGTDEGGVVTLITGNSDGTNVLPDVSEVIQVSVLFMGDNKFKVTFTNVSDNMTIAIPFTDPSARGPVPMSPFAWAVHTGTSPFFTTGEAASAGVEDIAEDGDSSVTGTRLSDNTGVIVPLSPGVYAVHSDGVMPLFNIGTPDRGEGLEGIAEDGTAADLAAFLKTNTGVSASNAFDTPDGAISPGAIGPGGVYSFSFEASPGDKLSLASMFVQSNDWFYSFAEGGMDLFVSGTPVTGDVSAAINLYDAGTEVDQYPGAGVDQVIRQAAANSGAADSDTSVRIVNGAAANVPASASDVIKVTITVQ